MCLQDFTPLPASHTLHPANTFFPVWQQQDSARLVPTSSLHYLSLAARHALSLGQKATCTESICARALIFTPACGSHTRWHFSIRQNGKAKAGCDANDLCGKTLTVAVTVCTCRRFYLAPYFLLAYFLFPSFFPTFLCKWDGYFTW